MPGRLWMTRGDRSVPPISTIVQVSAALTVLVIEKGGSDPFGESTPAEFVGLKATRSIREAGARITLRWPFLARCPHKNRLPRKGNALAVLFSIWTRFYATVP